MESKWYNLYKNGATSVVFCWVCKLNQNPISCIFPGEKSQIGLEPRLKHASSSPLTTGWSSHFWLIPILSKYIFSLNITQASGKSTKNHLEVISKVKSGSRFPSVQPLIFDSVECSANKPGFSTPKAPIVYHRFPHVYFPQFWTRVFWEFNQRV